MATLQGQQVKDSYKDLLQVSNSNAGVDATLRHVEDGEGTESALMIATTAVRVSGAFAVVGEAVLSASAHFYGPLIAKGGVEASSTASFHNNVDVQGTFLVKGVTTLTDVEVSGTAQFHLPVSFMNGIYVSGNSTFELGQVTMGTIKVSSCAAFNRTVVSGTASFHTGVWIGGTGDANNLDDYEEGTWTPGFSFGDGTTGITYQRASGRYTKVGNMVHMWWTVELTNNGSDAGTWRITGSPFTSEAGTEAHAGYAYWVLNVSAQPGKGIFFRCNAADTDWVVVRTDHSTMSNLTEDATKNTTEVNGVMHYRV